MASEDELLDAIDKLKSGLQHQNLMLQMLLAGGTQVNKRLDAIESLAITTAKLTNAAYDLIMGHLNMLDKLNALKPEPGEPSLPVKKETHPEFG